MQGNLDITAVRAALAQGSHAFRTGWRATGQMIRQGEGPTDFILVCIDGSEQPWSKPSDDLLARDWIVYTPPQGGQASPEQP